VRHGGRQYGTDGYDSGITHVHGLWKNIDMLGIKDVETGERLLNLVVTKTVSTDYQQGPWTTIVIRLFMLSMLCWSWPVPPSNHARGCTERTGNVLMAIELEARGCKQATKAN